MNDNVRLSAKLEAFDTEANREFRASCPPKSDSTIRVVELFAGVGGFRVGLDRASDRFHTVWSNQWEPGKKRQYASEIYRRAFGQGGHVNEDISTVRTIRIPCHDLLVGGFPCQDYSVATTLKNSRGIKGKKGVLWWQIHRILSEAIDRPRFLLFENVDRLLKSPSSRKGRDFAIILTSLADLGYLVEWRVINSADYGMPQRRRRTYIVAYRSNTEIALRSGLFHAEDWVFGHSMFGRAFPAEPKYTKASAQMSEFDISGTLHEVSDGFNKSSPKKSPFMSAGFMSGRHVWTADATPVYDGASMTLGDVLSDDSCVPTEFFLSDEEIPRWEYLKGAKSETRKTKDGFEYMYSEGAMPFPDSKDRPSRTIITGEGGKSPSRFKHVVLCGNGRLRRLMPVELERLNMFPDGHTVGVPDTARAFIMGNALVTGVVERIGIVMQSEI